MAIEQFTFGRYIVRGIEYNQSEWLLCSVVLRTLLAVDLAYACLLWEQIFCLDDVAALAAHDRLVGLFLVDHNQRTLAWPGKTDTELDMLVLSIVDHHVDTNKHQAAIPRTIEVNVLVLTKSVLVDSVFLIMLAWHIW